MLSMLMTRLQIERVLQRSYGSIVKRPELCDFYVQNEPMLQYRKGSKEREELIHELNCALATTQDVPIMIGGESFKTSNVRYQVMPHDHAKKLAKFYYADTKLINHAIDVAVCSQISWDRRPLDERVAIWLNAADMLAGYYRQKINAATMLGQSKTVIQAEVDSSLELIDFLRFNAYFLKEASKYQPLSVDTRVAKNSQRFRGIDGFVAAISPFNFTAIAGNLAYTPALMGNSVVWKPSDTAILSNWIIYNIMRDAGVPDGVVNFVPADGPMFGNTITKSRHLAGINFTGSVPTFNWLWAEVGKNINAYRNYPRLTGECGGKNYHLVHNSADVMTVVASTIRSAFEYSGQKCSACSRLYIPRSLGGAIKCSLLTERNRLRVGNVTDFSVFSGAVIDEKAFARITGYIERAKKNPNNVILGGGNYSGSVGYYIEPTIIETCDPCDKLMVDEIFGPILSIYIYDDCELNKTVELICNTTEFALTGSVFATDQKFLQWAYENLKMTAGNFYINDKSTGAVVGQQPFGGGRKSGTNDKAGGPHYLMCWTSPQVIKETFIPQNEIGYAYMRD